MSRPWRTGPLQHTIRKLVLPGELDLAASQRLRVASSIGEYGRATTRPSPPFPLVLVVTNDASTEIALASVAVAGRRHVQSRV